MARDSVSSVEKREQHQPEDLVPEGLLANPCFPPLISFLATEMQAFVAGYTRASDRRPSPAGSGFHGPGTWDLGSDDCLWWGLSRASQGVQLHLWPLPTGF